MEIFTDKISRILYSTDASAYREMPYGVCYPENIDDIEELISFAKAHKTSIIPRTAGTSLAGQVVGSGIVADVSKKMNHILEIDVENSCVRVEPGVVLDELNMFLAPYGLQFSPQTSTSSRCCIGGMVGNNSCGSHSLVYGSTRDHLLEAKVILSDGSKAVFSKKRGEEMAGILPKKCPVTLEERIYGQLLSFSKDNVLMEKIRREFPDSSLHRRNCGYALDLALEDFNLCKLLAGSEGTLAFIYELTLDLDPLPPKEMMLLCAHCDTLPKVFEANITALRHQPCAVDLIDDNILELSKKNLSQNRNRFFIVGEPAGILIAEFTADTRIELERNADALENDLIKSGLAYHCSRVYGKDIPRVWELRKAALGLLSGMKGDRKPVPVIEDTAVAPDKLAGYITDFKQMLDRLGLSCVYYGHIGSGELHLRPIMNLKDPKDRELFHTVALETAKLVKKYNGSLSGEHGDGRLRGEFIPLMYGEEIYGKLRELKHCWDPDGIFNPGKITDTPVMNESLRYDVGQPYPRIETYFDYSETNGIFCTIEQCNGSADCRRSNKLSGTMCPSYRAGMDEKFTTRARANILREMLTHPADPGNPFNSPEIYEVLELCLSCKGCKSECPSNIDMTRLKAEFLQHYYDLNGTPFRTWMVAHISTFLRLGSMVPGVYNYFATARWTSSLLKKLISFSEERGIPTLGKGSGKRFAHAINKSAKKSPTEKKVFLFADEFTSYSDTQVGRDFVLLLNRLGYTVVVPKHYESGRAAISKGLVKNAKVLAIKNVNILKDLITDKTPLVGIEPSTILSFRDEYPDLVPKEMKKDAISLARNSFLYDEFIMREVASGNISPEMFSELKAEVYLHGHCHQKAIVGIKASADMLSLPPGYHVNVIPSGCCGMAGSFGYEKEHYEFSLSVGEQVLFPSIRRAVNSPDSPSKNIIVCAPGTSCRQQILDGAGVRAIHPIQALLKALK